MYLDLIGLIGAVVLSYSAFVLILYIYHKLVDMSHQSCRTLRMKLDYMLAINGMTIDQLNDELQINPEA